MYIVRCQKQNQQPHFTERCRYKCRSIRFQGCSSMSPPNCCRSLYVNRASRIC